VRQFRTLIVQKQPPIIRVSNKTDLKGTPMHQNAVNPDAVCHQAIQAKLNVYQAKEQFETVLKMYNDQNDNLINLVALMKNRIVELEKELEGTKAPKNSLSTELKEANAG
jgi:hypothetical protein